jgi:uncharacterized protein
MRKAFFAPFILLAFWGMPAAAWQADLKIPAPAPVVDEFGLLSASESERLGNLLRELKGRSGVEVSVFVAGNLRELTIEDFSLAVVEQWKLGRRGEDKALLFLVAPRERAMRFEVGYGLEGEITDAFSRRVLDNVVRPYFLAGRYGDGILAGLAALQERVPLGIREGEAPSGRPSGGLPAAAVVFVLLVLIFTLSFLGNALGGSTLGYRRVGRGGWGRSSGWGGGLGGGGLGRGGGWGGGGGGFGGGGATSRW